MILQWRAYTKPDLGGEGLGLEGSETELDDVANELAELNEVNDTVVAK